MTSRNGTFTHKECGGVIFFDATGGWCSACHAECLAEDQYTEVAPPEWLPLGECRDRGQGRSHD